MNGLPLGFFPQILLPFLATVEDRDVWPLASPSAGQDIPSPVHSPKLASRPFPTEGSSSLHVPGAQVGSGQVKVSGTMPLPHS